jgi:uncharacterized OsmC-like protein
MLNERLWADQAKPTQPRKLHVQLIAIASVPACFAWSICAPRAILRIRSTRTHTSARRRNHMSDATMTDPTTRNGVDTATLFATRDAIKSDPGLAKFQFRATNRWISGAHSESTILGFSGARQEMTHAAAYFPTADHPAVLVGQDKGPAPVEFLLHALAACLTAGIANVAAARGIKLTEVTSAVEGDIDLLGVLGLSDEVRNGYQQIRVTFNLKGDDPEKLRQVAEQSRKRSAVYDVLTHGVLVSIDVVAG